MLGIGTSSFYAPRVAEDREVQPRGAWPSAPRRRSIGWPLAVLVAGSVVMGGAATAAIVVSRSSSSSPRRTSAPPPETSSSTTTPVPDVAANQVIAIENVLSRDSGKAFTKFQRAATHLSDLGRIVASANPGARQACDEGGGSAEACAQAFANVPDSDGLRAKVRNDVSTIADAVGAMSSAYHVAAKRLAGAKFRTAKANADAKVAESKLAAVSSEAFAIAAEMPQSPNQMRLTLLFTQLDKSMSAAAKALGALNHDLDLPTRLTLT
jgi:hypothetical protein